MVESQIEKQIKDYALSKGCLFHKLTGTKGIPDRLLVSPFGEVVFLELKKPGGSVAPLQKKRIKELTDRGVKAFVAFNVEEGKRIVDDIL